MYQLQVLTKQGYQIATFEAGNSMIEANACYKEFIKSGLYSNYHITINRRCING